MKQRLVRARRRIRDAAVPYSVPSDELLEARLPGVLAVLYLVFNEGYAPTSGSRVADRDLSTDDLERMKKLLDERLGSKE